ncbi:putative gag-pol polyprotein [Cucumis melo var. makuwa]|uniref:Gag-pol polyprotein n=1 Tax=Cucumis melo var. makuwa TaxID=1194695 RepID=A0A5A7V9S1_CUCMM|nr:putative gag-pol polyprotein [Cucumis melo var. makuwa]TYK27673.1 putative gag-pol polyprotein [Cucumis melo var. makuwa]
MSQFERFITQDQEQKVCKLNRSIYGLKQASRSWNIRFDTTINSYGFDQNVEEPCVYKKINKAQLQMKDLGEAQYVLGIQIIRDRIGSTCLRNKLIHAILYTRPDICYVVGIVSSIKQGCIADSTMEAEYVATCEATKEDVWLRKFQHDLEVVPNMNLLITLYYYNSGTIANSKQPCSHKRRKHTERRYHLIWEIVQRGDVIVTKIASEHNIADLFMILSWLKCSWVI